MKSKQQKILNCVIVGFGGMGNEHHKLIKAVDTLKLIGVYDIEPNQGLKAEGLGLVSYTSLDEVLADEAIDFIVIATPNHLHKDIAIKALRNKKHVICEKPVTINHQELDEILEVVEETGYKFIVHQNRRWDEDYLSVKQVYETQVIGDVFHIETKVQGSRGIPGDWRKEKEYGGGMMLDWGVHLIDRLIQLVDEPVESLFCKCSYIRNKDVDDGFVLHLTFASGKTALVEVGTYNYITMPLWYVLGTHGAMVIEDWSMNGKIHHFNNVNELDAKPIVAGAGLTKTMAPRDEKTMVISEVPRINVDYSGFYKNAYESFMGMSEQLIKNEEVRYIMTLMEAAMESSRLNEVIEIIN